MIFLELSNSFYFQRDISEINQFGARFSEAGNTFFLVPVRLVEVYREYSRSGKNFFGSGEIFWSLA